MSRRVLTRIIVSCALAAILVAALAHVPPARSLARQRIEAWAASQGVVARLEGLEYNAFTLRASVARATFAAAEHPEAPFADLEGLRVSVPWSVASGPLAIESLQASRVRLTLSRAAGGEWNLPPSQGGPATMTSLPIAAMRVERFDLVIDDRDGDFRLDVEGAKLELTPDGGAARGPLLLPAMIPITVAGQSYVLRGATSRVAYDGTDVTLEAFTSTVAGVAASSRPEGSLGNNAAMRAPASAPPIVGTVQLAGRVQSVYERARLDLHGEARIDLDGLARTLELPGAPSGPLAMSFRIDGLAADPRVRFEARAAALQWSGAEWRDAAASGEYTNRHLAVSSIRAAVAGGTLESRLRVGLEGEAPPSEFSGEWRDLSVAELFGIAGVGAPAALAVRATGAVTARWNAAALPSLELTASSALTPARGAVPVAGRLDMKALGGRWTLDHDLRLGATLGASGQYRGQLRDTFKDSSLEGTLSLEAEDLRALAADAAAVALAVPSDLIHQLGGAARGTVRLAGTLGAPLLQAEVRADPISFGRLASGAAAVAAHGTTSSVRIDSARIDFARLHASASGDVDLARSRLDLDVRAETDDLASLSDAAPALASAGVTTGQISLTGKIAGSPSKPVASAEIDGRNLIAAGQHLDSIGGRVRIDRDSVLVEGLDLRQCAPATVPPCEARLALDGRYDWTNGRIAARVKGRDLTISPVPAGVAAEAAIPVSGRVSSIAVDVAGPYSRLTGEGIVDLAGLVWDGYHAGPVRVEARLDGESALLDARAPQVGITGRAKVGQAAPWPFTLDVDLASTDARALAGGVLDVPPDVVMALATSLQARGDLASPERATVAVDLSHLQGRARGVDISLASPSRFEWRTGRLEVGDTTLTVGGLTVRAGGALAERDSRLSASFSGDLADVGSLASLAGVTPIEGAAGTLDGRIDVTGPAARPVLAGHVELRGGLARIKSLPDITGIEIRADLAEGILALNQATAAWQGAVVNARGGLPLNAAAKVLPAAWATRLPTTDGPAWLSATFAGLTSRVVEPFLPPDVVANLSASVSGTLEIASDDLTVQGARGALTLSDASFVFSGIPLAQTQPTRFDLADGRLRVTTAEFVSQGNRLFVTGGAALAGPRGPRFDLAADATLDLRLPGAFLSEISTGGTAEVSISLSGPPSAPNIDGQATVRNGEWRLRDPRVAITGVEGTILLTRDEVRLDRMSGLANGGPVSVTGGLRLEGFTIASGRFEATGTGVALDWPPGLRTESDGEVTLTFEGPGLPPRLAGRVVVQRGAYRDPLSLVALARYAATPAPVVPEPTLLDRMRLDVAVTSTDDVVFDNNYGRFTSGLDLVVRGTFLQPTLDGRVALREGGQVFLGGNVLRIDRGVVDFTPSARITPELDIVTRTRVGRYDLSVTLSGPPENLQVDLASESDPNLTSTDIASLLVSGQTAGRTTESQAAREQVISLFSGELLNLAGRAVGLDSVRVDRGSTAEDVRFDPSLVATEVDPAARLTVSKRLGTDVEVIASRSLRESGDLTWIVGYSPRGLLAVRAIARDDDTRSLELTREQSFGGTRRSTRRQAPPPPPRVVQVTFDGEPGLDAKVLQGRLRVREGKPFDFYRWQEDRDRILEAYHERDFLEASVDAKREALKAGEAGAGVLLRYTVTPGPRTEIVVNGARMPAPVMRAMRESWTSSVFDGFLADDLARQARLAMVRDGHVRAVVAARVVVTADRREKKVVIDVEPGPSSRSRRVVFEGHQAMSKGALDEAVTLAGQRHSLWLDPAPAVTAIRQACARAGLLDAAVEAVGPAFEGDTATMTFRINEGARYGMSLAAVNGAIALPEAEVRRVAEIDADTRYTPGSLDAVLRRVERMYRQEGFNTVRVDTRQVVRRDASRVDVTIDIVEGARQVLAGIDVRGADRTNPRIVERALDLDVGGPANLEEWSKAQRRLYDAGVFRLADIEPEPAGPAVTSATGRGLDQPVRARVQLEEWPSLRLRYGVLVSDSPGDEAETRNRAPGLVAEVQQRNLFGRTASAGLGGRYEKDFRVGRAYLATPRLFGLPLLSSAYVAFQRRVLNSQGELPFVNTKQTAGAEQRLRLGFPLEVSWNLSLERSRVFELDPDPDNPFPLDLTVTLARVATSLSYDQRDDPFDSTRGWLHTANVEYSAAALGDESLFGGARFVKYIGQQFFFIPVWRDVVLASALRVGLANGFGQEVVIGERFLLGGSTTVRGYADQSLGPRDVFGNALGGEAMLVLNQEIRFPIVGWLRGVAFVDAGNVFDRPRAIDLGALDLGAGAGLRLVTPYALIRVDYGMPMARGLGFKDGRWYFSVGQAF